MAVVIGELEVVAAPPPREPEAEPAQPAPGLQAADVAGILRSELQRQARCAAD